MSTVKAESKLGRYWWLALMGLCLLPCLTFYTCRLDPKAVLATIPIGSKLSELDKHLGKFYEDSSVLEWHSDHPSDSTGHRETKYGSFYIRDLGKYERWKATKAERDDFSGELLFYHYSAVIPDDLAPSYVYSLVYLHGVLREKECGHLPG